MMANVLTASFPGLFVGADYPHKEGKSPGNEVGVSIIYKVFET